MRVIHQQKRSVQSTQRRERSQRREVTIHGKERICEDQLAARGGLRKQL
jgi:hypothetical protein